jgi:hypothetical protein
VDETASGQINTLQELRDHVDLLAVGPITDARRLESLLLWCWDAFDGSDAEGMSDYKLHGRIEEPVWEPPLLRFSIERHGATFLGSSRAEIHRWTLDLDAKTATCAPHSYRQVRPAQARLDVQPLVEEVLEAMRNRRADERLNWQKDGTVRVHIGKIIPEASAAKQTVAGRRERFRNALTATVQHAGGEVVRPNVYRLPPDLHLEDSTPSHSP